MQSRHSNGSQKIISLAAAHHLASDEVSLHSRGFEGFSKEVSMAHAKKPIPEGYHTMTPGLTLDNAAQTMEWYKKALGAEELGRHLGPDGKIMHAELKIGDSRFMVNDAMPGS